MLIIIIIIVLTSVLIWVLNFSITVPLILMACMSNTWGFLLFLHIFSWMTSLFGKNFLLHVLQLTNVTFAVWVSSVVKLYSFDVDMIASESILDFSLSNKQKKTKIFFSVPERKGKAENVDDYVVATTVVIYF